MNLTPSKIYENYRGNVLCKTETVDLLISLFENTDDDIIRRECLEILNKLDFNYKRIFKIIEDIFISEPNESLRFSAAKIIRSKFLKKSVSPFLWALQHESSYNCLITIIKSLEEINDDRIATSLKEKIEKIYTESIYTNLIPIEDFFKYKSYIDLADILINYITIKYLTKKFKNIIFKFEKGLASEIDFSNVDSQVISWRDRELLQNRSDIIGIQNLRFYGDF